MRVRTLAVAAAGPAAFALAAKLGARREPAYVPRDEPISALAAQGMRSAPVMIPGFFGLAAGSIALARELRGAASAPAPVPALLALAGVAVAGAGLARCSDRSCPMRVLGDTDVTLSDDVHVAVSAVAFALWTAIPLVAARKATRSGAYRSASAGLGIATFAGLFGGGMLAKRDDERWSGAAQRATLLAAFSWYVLAAVSA